MTADRAELLTGITQRMTFAVEQRGEAMRPPYDDYCYECCGYGDDYYIDDDGELKCRCPECPFNDWEDDDE